MFEARFRNLGTESHTISRRKVISERRKILIITGTFFFVTPRKPPCARNVASTVRARCARSTLSAFCGYVRERLARVAKVSPNIVTKVISKKTRVSSFPFKTVCDLRSTASVNRVGHRFDERTRRRSRARSTGKGHTPRMRRATHHDGRWTDARVDPGRARSSTRIGARRVRSASARAARGSASAARVRTVVKRVPRGAPPGDSSSVEKLPFRKLAREKARVDEKKTRQKVESCAFLVWRKRTAFGESR